MTHHADAVERFGADLTTAELERLASAEALIRFAGPMDEAVPETLKRSILRDSQPSRLQGWRRRVLALPIAAALAAGLIGAGMWLGAPDFTTTQTTALSATSAAEGASAVVRVGDRDPESGNLIVQLEVSGLPPLEKDNYYVLWMSKDGAVGDMCGVFNVGEGKTTVRFSVTYDLADYDEWVITEHLPHANEPPLPPTLLTADIEA